MKYQKKRIIIDAFRCGVDNIPDWAMDKVTSNDIIIHKDRDTDSPFDHDVKVSMTIRTLEGDMLANHGDYIIRGIKGEIYPCKADIFNETYDAYYGEEPIKLDKGDRNVFFILNVLKVLLYFACCIVIMCVCNAVISIF